jgi:putative membrane protein
MNIAQTFPLADSWGMHGNGVGAGWVIVMGAMMALFMGAMMWMMMRGMGGDSSRGSSAPWDRFATRESPLEALERRFAEGEISIEEYQARRDALVNGTAEPSAHHDEETLTAPRVGGGKR